MDYKKLVESLEKMLPPKIPYGELVGAPWPYTGQGEMVYEEPESYFIEQAITAITDLLARVEAAESRAEKAERERNAAIKELNRVSAAVDELSDMIDSEVHPIVDYSLYLSLRENFDAISIWEYESEWHGLKEE